MQITPYLSFKGDCEAAFTLYERCLGGKGVGIFRYAGSPMADQVPADWGNKLMHGSVTIGDQVLMGGDVAPESYEQPKGFTLSIQVASAADAERIFHELSKGGRVVLPLEKTFWAERFGILVDPFGIPWQINCEGSGVKFSRALATAFDNSKIIGVRAGAAFSPSLHRHLGRGRPGSCVRPFVEASAQWMVRDVPRRSSGCDRVGQPPHSRSRRSRQRRTHTRCS